MKKINKRKFNWFGFKHSKIKKHFEGISHYCGTFSVKVNSDGEYVPCAVYYSKNPNRKKGHKDYLLLTTTDALDKRKMYVLGRDAAEMEEERYQLGKYCPKCEELIYSVSRHDYRTCKCGECSVDGGKDYFRCSVKGEDVKIDLITGEEVLPNSIKFIKSCKRGKNGKSK